MKYMLLIHQGSAPTPYQADEWARLSDDEQKAVAGAYQAINETPGVSPGLGLQPPETATTVRVQDGRTLTTDGPFVAVKEALGGYFVFEADDLDGYHYLHATRAELLRRLDRFEDARAAYDRALELVHSDAERRFLERRLEEIR